MYIDSLSQLRADTIGFANLPIQTILRNKTVGCDDSLMTDNFDSEFHSTKVIRFPNITSAFDDLLNPKRTVEAVAYEAIEITYFLNSEGFTCYKTKESSDNDDGTNAVDGDPNVCTIRNG